MSPTPIGHILDRWAPLLAALAAHDRAWPDNDDDRGPHPPPNDDDSDGLPPGGVDPYDREDE